MPDVLGALPATADRWIVDAMAGVAPVWQDLDADAVLARPADHGVGALLFGLWSRAGHLREAPPPVADALRQDAGRAAAFELAGRAQLRQVCGACTRAQVDALLLKGAALAYDIYDDASWRARCDVDLLIRAGDRQRAIDSLLALGYAMTAEPLGTRVSHQVQLEQVDAWGVRHVCDIHWKLSNRARFAGAFSFDELRQASIALPRISAEARGLGHEHALWLACVHQLGHHHNDPRAIWLYDVHLLVKALGEEGIGRFASLALRTGIARLAQTTLRMSAAWFGTSVPDDVWRALDRAKDEPSAIYLRAEIAPVEMLRDDLAALGSWRERAALMAEHLFPAPSYMRRTFRPHSKAPLFWLYGVRLATGVGKWLRAVAPPSA